MQPCKRAEQILTNLNFAGDSEDSFIPKSSLPAKLFNDRTSIREILRCHSNKCDNCKADYRFICSSKRIRIEPEENIDRILTSATLLFALLISIRHPLLIVPLLEHGRNDKNILDSFCAGSFEYPKIKDNYWKECLRTKEDTEAFSQEIAVLIRRHISIFFRPSFGDDKFHVVHEKLRFATYGEREIGHGSYGRVIAFKIFDGHNKFTHCNGTQDFARKVIVRNAETGFLPGHVEGQVLSKVNALKNPHFVQIVTSFTHGDEFNIVFRRARTNLEKALRDPQHLLSQTVSPLLWCPLWEQMLGLAQALHEFQTGKWKTVQTHEDHEIISEEAESAIHFDLKPSNILLDRSSRINPVFQFVITDFGLARIKAKAGGSSGTHDRGGDEEYAPPECMLPDQNRKYDIWSLGCIFLEIVTFLVMGYPGVRKLDDSRRQTRPDKIRQTHCFWEQFGQPGQNGEESLDGFRLRETVKDFISTLRSDAATTGRYSLLERRLVNNTLSMIEKMLCIQPRTRLTSSDVVWWLERVGRGEDMQAGNTASSQHSSDIPTLGTASPDRADSPDRTEAPVTASQITKRFWWEPVAQRDKGIRYADERDSETELEPYSLRRLQRLLVRSNVDPSEEDSNAVLQVFTSGLDHLRFVVILTNLSEERPLEQTCLRRDVHLMPQYAFRKRHTTGRSDAGIRLMWKQDSTMPIMRYDITGHLDELRIVHSALLGQEVYHTAEVEDVRITPTKSIFQWLFRRTHKWSKNLSTEHGPFTVQLWREKHGNPRTCRFVIYFSTIACVIPFHQYLRFPDNTTMMRQPETTLLESSTVDNTKQTFEMTVLQTTKQSGSLPTFPLHTEELENMLTEHPVSFKAISIDFRASEHLMDLWKAYRVLKEDWLNESGIVHNGSQQKLPDRQLGEHI